MNPPGSTALSAIAAATASAPPVSAPSGAERTAVLEAARLALARDLTLAFRRRSQLVQPLAFFAMVAVLFPLTISLEQYALSGQSLTCLMFAKTAAHWLLTGLPLALMAPLVAVSLGAPGASLPGIIASVAVGSVALSLI